MTNTEGRNKKIGIGIGMIVVFIVIMIITTNMLEKKKEGGKIIAIPTPMENKQEIGEGKIEKTSIIEVKQAGNNSVEIIVNAGKGTISGVQLQIAYDPQILTKVSIEKGTFFTNAIELGKQRGENNGMINYAIAILPKEKPQGGKGVVARITYTPVLGIASNARLTFLPGTKVTAEGIDESVLQMPPPFTLAINQ